MSETYINANFNKTKEHASDVEKRLDDLWCTKESILEENEYNFKMCRKYDCNYILIDDRYRMDIEL